MIKLSVYGRPTPIRRPGWVGAGRGVVLSSDGAILTWLRHNPAAFSVIVMMTKEKEEEEGREEKEEGREEEEADKEDYGVQ